MVAFFLIYFNQGDKFIVSEICKSVQNYVTPDCENHGQMFWIGKDLENHVSVQDVKLSHFIIYSFSVILVYFFILLNFVILNLKLKICILIN